VQRLSGTASAVADDPVSLASDCGTEVTDAVWYPVAAPVTCACNTWAASEASGEDGSPVAPRIGEPFRSHWYVKFAPSVHGVASLTVPPTPTVPLIVTTDGWKVPPATICPLDAAVAVVYPSKVPVTCTCSSRPRSADVIVCVRRGTADRRPGEQPLIAQGNS
jgi:hypothetical protein